MRIMIVGQARSREGGGGHKPPFVGMTGKRLCGMSGLTYDQFRIIFDCRNLIDFYPGSYGNGDRFPTREARLVATGMELPKRVVLLGRKVAAAFGVYEDLPFLEWFNMTHQSGKVLAMIFPHPSGMSRWWNDPENTRSASLAMGQLVQLSEGGIREWLRRRKTK